MPVTRQFASLRLQDAYLEAQTIALGAFYGELSAEISLAENFESGTAEHISRHVHIITMQDKEGEKTWTHQQGITEFNIQLRREEG